MNIQGKLHIKFDTADVSASFQKREFVVEYAENPMYPQLIKFQLVQDKCALLDNFQVGSMIDVSFNLRGREWTSPQGETKYFNSLDAWRIAAAAETVTATPVQQPAGNGMPPAGEDLPF